MFKISFFLILLFPLNNVMAYSADFHAPLVSTSITVFNACLDKEKNQPISETHRKRIVHGDLAMDNGLPLLSKDRYLQNSRVFSIWKRINNWHFYNEDLSKHSREGWFEQSHIRLWDMLKEGLRHEKLTQDKALFLGGIIHLIEDITVPAHVVPVYHSVTAVATLNPKFTPLVDYMQERSIKNLFIIKDKVDKIEPATKKLKYQLSNEPNLCRSTRENTDSLNKIRSDTAKETLALIKESIPNCPDLTWQIFWTKPETGEYFGRYNLKTNNLLFGEKGIITSANNNKCEMTPDKYNNFVFKLHNNAIKADMKVLNWAYDKIKKHPSS